MRIKGLCDEDFVNYKKPAMFIICRECDFKCDRLIGRQVCQNGILAGLPDIDIPTDKIIQRYIDNPISEAIVFGGLEPFAHFDEIENCIDTLRNKYHRQDTVVLYTGYYRAEIDEQIKKLQKYPNIIVKFGRYVPGDPPHMDGTLGVMLASQNQYAERIS